MDAQANEAITHFAWLLARCGFSRDEAAHKFRSVCNAIPRLVGRDGIGSGCTADEASHVITLWYMTSGYLGRHGKPMAVPLLGPAPSLEALVNEVNPKLTVADVLDYLDAAKALKRSGNLYLPRSRVIAHRPGSRFQHAHQLRAVAGLLRTVEHNSHGRIQRFEYLADGTIPASKLRGTMRNFRPTAMAMLQYADASMLRLSAPAKGKRKNVSLSVGVFVFEGRALSQDKGGGKPAARSLSSSKTAARGRERPAARVKSPTQ